MNNLLVLMSSCGFFLVAIACLKVLETGPTIGPPFSPAARLVLLMLVFLMAYSGIEGLGWARVPRPGGSTAVFVLGCFSVWRVFSPSWASFFTRPSSWHRHFGAPPKF